MHLPEFEALGLAPACLEALAHEGYEKPTPIQAATIPPLLAGRDILGCAQTGTGKTAAFALPTIQYFLKNPAKKERKCARALVVAPTRELAIQIDASFAAYGRHAGLKRACVYGGVGKQPQIKALERGVDVLVATPGRLLDLHGEGHVDLSAVEIAVLDEADRMLDMGFIHDVKRIMKLLPTKRQTLLFSATMPDEIMGLANSFLRDPARVSIDPEQPAVERIKQTLYYAEKGAKRELLAYLIKSLDVSRAVVFSKTKHGADRIAKFLHQSGIEAGVIHANKGQGNRTKTMDAFRSGETRILVATDIAARGIDVDEISHVFNFDQPTEPETYVHRIGRTARAGADGTAISFCDAEEKKYLRQVERLLGKPIDVVRDHPFSKAGSYEPEVEEPRPPRQPRGRAQGRNGGGQGRGAQGRQGDGGRPERRGAQPPKAAANGRGDGRGESRRGEQPRGERQQSTRSEGSRRRPETRVDERSPDRGSEGGRERAKRPAARPPAFSSGAPRKDVRNAIDEITGRMSRLG